VGRMISSATATNIYGLKDVTVELERFTVIVGPNACGKTTFLKSLSNTVSLPDGGTVLVCRSSGEGELHTSADFVAANHDPRESDSPGVQARGQFFYSPLYLALNASSIRRGSQLGQTISESGLGLGAVLAKVRLEQIDGAQRLATALSKIVPGVVNVGIEASWLKPFVEFEGIGRVAVDQLSEGTLFALVIVALLELPEPPNVLLIDDLDKGLHPSAFVELVNVLRSALASNPTLQIVATTHSPYLLGCFEADEVRVFARKEDGSAACSKLTDHPDFEHWKDSLDPGEFWASVGEEWVLSK
jgi:predicted ATPase